MIHAIHSSILCFVFRRLLPGSLELACAQTLYAQSFRWQSDNIFWGAQTLDFHIVSFFHFPCLLSLVSFAGIVSYCSKVFSFRGLLSLLLLARKYHTVRNSSHPKAYFVFFLSSRISLLRCQVHCFCCRRNNTNAPSEHVCSDGSLYKSQDPS